MKHSIEDLGEFADSNADGQIHIFQTGHAERGRHSPDTEPWGCKIGVDCADTQYGATPDEAVTRALNAHDRMNNPDGQEARP